VNSACPVRREGEPALSLPLSNEESVLDSPSRCLLRPIMFRALGPISERTGSSEAVHSRAGSPRKCSYRRKGIGTKGRKDHEETMVVE
jgi:hypothetical protein